MQEIFLVEERWHVSVVSVTRMYLEHRCHSYFNLSGAEEVLGKPVPTLTEEIPFLLPSHFFVQPQFPAVWAAPAFTIPPQVAMWFLFFFSFPEKWMEKWRPVCAGGAASGGEAEAGGRGAGCEAAARSEVWRLHLAALLFLRLYFWKCI